MLTAEEQRELLEIARESIASALAGGAERHAVSSRTPSAKHEWSGRLAEPSGAFVTVHHEGDLRGCIGYISSDLPLAEVVAEVAVKAATEDPRFRPMSQGELSESTLEVSVLSPLVQVHDPSEVEVGRHGVLLELGRARGLLLPQVAVEYGWDREMFLNHTARKAGLRVDAWKDPQALIYVFTAEVVHESEEETRRV